MGTGIGERKLIATAAIPALSGPGSMVPKNQKPPRWSAGRRRLLSQSRHLRKTVRLSALRLPVPRAGFTRFAARKKSKRGAKTARANDRSYPSPSGEGRSPNEVKANGVGARRETKPHPARATRSPPSPERGGIRKKDALQDEALRHRCMKTKSGKIRPAPSAPRGRRSALPCRVLPRCAGAGCISRYDPSEPMIPS